MALQNAALEQIEHTTQAEIEILFKFELDRKLPRQFLQSVSPIGRSVWYLFLSVTRLFKWSRRNKYPK